MTCCFIPSTKENYYESLLEANKNGRGSLICPFCMKTLDRKDLLQYYSEEELLAILNGSIINICGSCKTQIQDRSFKLTNCGHIFHLSCIQQSLFEAPSCPVDGNNINQNDIDEIMKDFE